MSNETIPLAKPFNEKKLKFPVYFSEKFDGVPIKLTVNVPAWPEKVTYTAVTRQGEAMLSCKTILDDFVQRVFVDELQTTGKHVFVGEVLQSEDVRAPFKDTSGMVRRQEDQGWKLVVGIFDYWLEDGNRKLVLDAFMPFDVRLGYMQIMLKAYWRSTAPLKGGVRKIPHSVAQSVEELTALFEALPPDAEGGIARNHDDASIAGKRSWGYQKMLNEPTADLLIIGCEEATSASGEPLGMAGRLLANYKGEKIGIGPGKLTHPERKLLWEYFQKPLSGPRMAQIKYKRDTSYKALRQPTFQHWRDDKKEESYE